MKDVDGRITKILEDMDGFVSSCCDDCYMPLLETKQALLELMKGYMQDNYDRGYSDGFTAKNKKRWSKTPPTKDKKAKED